MDNKTKTFDSCPHFVSIIKHHIKVFSKIVALHCQDKVRNPTQQSPPHLRWKTDSNWLFQREQNQIITTLKKHSITKTEKTLRQQTTEHIWQLLKSNQLNETIHHTLPWLRAEFKQNNPERLSLSAAKGCNSGAQSLGITRLHPLTDSSDHPREAEEREEVEEEVSYSPVEQRSDSDQLQHESHWERVVKLVSGQ